jgi:hypothetical protein
MSLVFAEFVTTWEENGKQNIAGKNWLFCNQKRRVEIDKKCKHVMLEIQLYNFS